MNQLPADARQSPRDPTRWVTPSGQVYSYRKGIIRLLRPNCASGYATVRVQGRQQRVHILVAELFLGPRPSPWHICRHIGARSDNSVGNLCWDRHGNALKPPKGEQHYFAKLTEPQVVEIIELLATRSFMQKTLAQRFNVSPETIGAIAHGRVWKHVPRPARLAA